MSSLRCHICCSPSLSLPICFSTFSIKHYNWSDNSVDDSLWLGPRAQCIQSNQVLQPVTNFHYSSWGELIVPVSTAPLFRDPFSLCLLSPTRPLHIYKTYKRQCVQGELRVFFFIQNSRSGNCASARKNEYFYVTFNQILCNT